MNAILLTGQHFAGIPAGVERFSGLLKKAFPSLEILSFDTLFEKTPPFVAEPFKSWRLADALQKKPESFSPDIVFFNGMYGWALPKKTPFLKIGICHGTYHSFARHALPLGLEKIRTGLVFAWFEKKSFENADCVISNSSFTKKILQDDYGVKSVSLPFGIDFSVFKPADKTKAKQRAQIPPEKPLVLFVGRPDYTKGFDLFEQLARNNPQWHFLAVTFPKTKSRFVDCRGPFNSQELSLYYSAADAALLPSRFESFGFATLEALACHTPVVASNFGIARELAHPACRVVESLEADALQAALEATLGQPSRFPAWFEKKFSLERFSQDFRKRCEKSFSEKQNKKG